MGAAKTATQTHTQQLTMGRALWAWLAGSLLTLQSLAVSNGGASFRFWA